MKRFVLLLLVGTLLTACSANEEEIESIQDEEEKIEEETVDESNSEEIEEKEVINSDENPDGFDRVFSDPEKYRGYGLEFKGRVFTQPERDDDGVYMQVFADPEEQEKNVIVGIAQSDFDVEMDDFISVDGMIMDVFEGENAYGGPVFAPMVRADNIEVIDYTDAVSPPIETIDVDDSQDQHGYVLNVEKIDIAKNMTRVYITVTNNTKNNINFYTFNSKLVIDNKQLEEDSSLYNTGLPEVSSEILPGVESEGVITFPPIDPSVDKLTFHAEGSSDNFELDFEPFLFEVEVD